MSDQASLPPDPHRGFKHMSPVEVKVRIRTGEMSEDAVREWWRIARELVPEPPPLPCSECGSLLAYSHGEGCTRAQRAG